MKKIEIHSSKTKSIRLLLVSLVFVIGSIYVFLNAKNITGYSSERTIYLRTLTSIVILFFGAGLYVTLKPIIKSKLFLIIDEIGVNVDPSRSLIISWNNIISFSEVSIHNQLLIIIDVNNPEYWIERENSWIRKKLMKYNFNNYGSPFNLSTNSMEINHRELMRSLNENLKKYKKQP